MKPLKGTKKEIDLHVDSLTISNYHPDHIDGFVSGFEEGAEWGFKQAIQMLKAKSAFDNLNYTGEHRLANEQLADWLMSIAEKGE